MISIILEYDVYLQLFSLLGGLKMHVCKKQVNSNLAFECCFFVVFIFLYSCFFIPSAISVLIFLSFFYHSVILF